MAILTAAFLTSLAIKAAIAVGVNLLVSAFVKKPKTDTGSLDFEQTVQRRLRLGEPLHVVAGKRFVSGVAAFDDSYSTRNEQGLSVTILSCKPITGYDRITVDGEVVTLSGNPTTGEVFVSSHFLGINNTPRLRIRLFLGDNNAGLGAFLNAKDPTKFGVNDNFGDYAVLVVDAQNTNDDLDEDNGENFIPFQGYPDVRVEVEGVKVCDPRAGGIYGDETTYVYSNNAALIDAQYDYGWYSGIGAGRILAVGNGFPIEIMPVAKIIDSANYCDAEGFTCNGVLKSGSNNDQDEIWKCFNGQRVETPSEVYTVPEGNRVNVGVLDLSNYPASFIEEYDAEGYSTEVYNEILTTYSEPEQFYGETELPIYSEAAWIATDDHIFRQLELPLLMVTDRVHAAKLQKQEICLSRGAATALIKELPPKYKYLNVGEIIEVQGAPVGGVNRTWVIQGKGQSSRLDVSLSLKEYVPNAFAFDAATETPVVSATIPPVRLWTDWQFPAPYTNPQTVQGIVNGTQVLQDVTLQNIGSISSKQSAQDANIDATNTSGTGFSVSVSASSVTQTSTTPGANLESTPTVTASANNPAGGVTWSWARISGNTGITASSPSSATSAFQANVPNDQVWTATFRVTGDDGVETKTRDVSVTIIGHFSNL